MGNLYLFDFDGVIVDSISVYEHRVVTCLEKMGRPIVKNRSEFLDLFEDNFYEALTNKGINLEEFMSVLREISREEEEDNIVPFYPLLNVIGDIHNNNNFLAVISSNSSRIIHKIISKYNLNGLFSDVLGSDFGLSKKDKIFHTINCFGVLPEKTFYIGDTTGDIREARAAGVKTVAVTWGWHSKERLALLNPDYLIDTPDALLTLQ